MDSYKATKEFWDWPRDPDRYKLFPDEAKEHPAKMNTRMFLRLMELYSKPGDTILDPMSGIGTVHMAAWHGRHTVGLELNPRFAEIQRLAYEGTLPKAYGRSATGTIAVLVGDCRRLLPLPVIGFPLVDAVIFSPPYGNTIKAGRTAGFKRNESDKASASTSYGGDPASVGELDMASYGIAMKIIYEKILGSMKPGAFMVTVTQDFVRQRKRVPVTQHNIRVAMEAGFPPPVDWHKRNSPGGLGAQVERVERRELGIVIEENTEEDAVVFRKEGAR